ncbi:unnamed protein product, partial [Didymodactylos carnosus]
MFENQYSRILACTRALRASTSLDEYSYTDRQQTKQQVSVNVDKGQIINTRHSSVSAAFNNSRPVSVASSTGSMAQIYGKIDDNEAEFFAVVTNTPSIRSPKTRIDKPKVTSTSTSTNTDHFTVTSSDIPGRVNGGSHANEEDLTVHHRRSPTTEEGSRSQMTDGGLHLMDSDAIFKEELNKILEKHNKGKVNGMTTDGSTKIEKGNETPVTSTRPEE